MKTINNTFESYSYMAEPDLPDKKMLGSTLYLLLVLSFASANPYCAPRDTFYSPIVSTTYSHVYSNMEKALKSIYLEDLKNGFMSKEEVILYIGVTVEVVNGTNYPCPDDQWHTMAFCPSNSSDYDWDLCKPLVMIYGYRYDPVLESVPWLSTLHGSLLLFAVVLTSEQDPSLEAEIPFRLEIDELICHPSVELMKCVVSELFSWIKIYSEQSSNPQLFDHNQKGSVTLYEDIEFSVIDGVHQDTFINVGLAEYVIVSLTVALLIAVYFPAVHKQIVPRANRLELQSLYWGTAVVCNVFTYGFLFIAGRGTTLYLNYTITPSKVVLIVAVIQEVIVYIILLVGSVFVLIKGHSDIPVRKGVASAVIYTSFCCFGLCASFSKMTIKVMIVFSFMNFIYHNVMDFISLAFIMFVDRFRAKAITVSILYVALVVFLNLSTSYILFRLLQLLRRKKHLALLTFFATIVIICFAVIFLLMIFMSIFFSVKTSGLNVVATALLPSILLSGGSLYIKKKFQAELETIAEPENDGEELDRVP